ncbi:hypothetical protein [Rheinheimera mangrovi]|jgi:hypothetical protein|uniref:hypothetical protein n=1 Tax=Rheinheimera mangrovi TaxID=2498451 RepID=UPI000F8D4E62|nr:hypothetical protein [Rheinheimera mangrovi]
MKAFIMRFIHPVYREQPGVLALMIFTVLCFGYQCYLTDQFFAFVGAIVYASLAIRCVYHYIEKKTEK